MVEPWLTEPRASARCPSTGSTEVGRSSYARSGETVKPPRPPSLAATSPFSRLRRTADLDRGVDEAGSRRSSQPPGRTAVGAIRFFVAPRGPTPFASASTGKRPGRGNAGSGGATTPTTGPVDETEAPSRNRGPISPDRRWTDGARNLKPAAGSAPSGQLPTRPLCLPMSRRSARTYLHEETFGPVAATPLRHRGGGGRRGRMPRNTGSSPTLQA